MTQATPLSGQFQLFDPLPEDEYAVLKASIAKKGLLVPITKDQQGNILDGHHRERACRELGIKPRFEIVVCETDQDRRIRVLVMNLLRRHLSREQKAKAVGELRVLGYTFEDIQAETGIPRASAHRLISQLGNEDQPAVVTNARGQQRPATYNRQPKQTIVFAKDDQEAERAQQALAVLGNQVPTKVFDIKQAERVARELYPNKTRLVELEPEQWWEQGVLILHRQHHQWCPKAQGNGEIAVRGQRLADAKHASELWPGGVPGQLVFPVPALHIVRRKGVR